MMLLLRLCPAQTLPRAFETTCCQASEDIQRTSSCCSCPRKHHSKTVRVSHCLKVLSPIKVLRAPCLQRPILVSRLGGNWNGCAGIRLRSANWETLASAVSANSSQASALVRTSWSSVAALAAWGRRSWSCSRRFSIQSLMRGFRL